MSKNLISLFFVLGQAIGYSQVLVRTVTEVDINTIAYPNTAGNTTSSQPHKGTVKLADGSFVSGKITFFKKKDVLNRVKVNTGEEKKEIESGQIASIVLDPLIYEKKYPNNYKNPEKNFQPGYIVLPSGEKLTGKIAQLRDFSDYDFFIYTVLFLPDGSDVASSFKGGRLIEFGQEVEGQMKIWDGYADGYLVRLVDGRYRLCRNPYSSSKNEFFTSLKNQVTDSLSKQAAQSALTKSLKSGTNLNESIENAANAGSVVSEVFGKVDINRKEYLIFDASTKTITTVNKDSFREYVKKISLACAVPVDLQSWEKIDAVIRFQNTNCQ